jgi:putative glycosyl hydrolase-like family 6 (GHL6) protein
MRRVSDRASPWHRRVYRWGQTNLTEIDPARYDADWWRAQWRRTRVQGIIVNAGGIVAYYPSRSPLHHRAVALGERDFYGEIVAAAREEGLAVLARMDSNRADERCYQERPDWFAVDAAGRPYRAGERYVACINSPYYSEHLTDMLREIVERSRPDGFTDNSWSGLDRDHICYCAYCARKFRAATGLALPKAVNWEDQTYRRWIEWSYQCRIDVWELNNRVTTAAGGPDCLWIGMNAGDIVSQSQRLRDYRAICERTEIIMLDSQYRVNARGFQSNGEMGKLIHGLLGWEKLIPESLALYGAGQPSFRLASKPAPEARMWAVEGFAGGIQPWWHHIGAYHEDRRQYRTAEPIFRWHEENDAFLVDRRPVATVGVVWTQRNTDFYGREAAEERTALPQRGVRDALIRARIPSLPVHADHVERDAAAHGLALLILPNVSALSDAQCAAIRRFVERGGGLLATGESSLYDEWGERRDDFALADLFGARATGAHHGASGAADPSWEAWAAHTYLRLSPELRAGVDGPQVGGEPALAGERHPALRGFDETDILSFGGRLEAVRPAEGMETPLAYVPPFPIFPPETAWMRQPATALPALVLNARGAGGRVAYLPADIDRCFGRDNLPDHADLLANLVRWAAGDRIPLQIDGPGLIDPHLYRQGDRLVLHLVNLTSAGTWRAPIHELIPVGPLRVRVQLPEGSRPRTARLLVGGGEVPVEAADGWAAIEVASVTDHEVIVIE